MQVLPLMTPTNFNNKKRPRSEDDFESNYLKKRVISSPPRDASIEGTRSYVTHESKHNIRIDDMDQFLLDNQDDTVHLHCNHQPSRIDMLDFNGTFLPMEHKTGETRYCIPEFVLKKKSPSPSSTEAAKSGQLILYQPNTLLPLSPPSTPTHEKQHHDDPMDID